MPKLIKSVEGEVYDVINGPVVYVKTITGEFQQEDYINVNGFIAYLQNFTRAEQVSTLVVPLTFGLPNTYNIQQVTLNIDY